MAETDPALIVDNKLAGPSTHVLLVGIGTYPWLIGGSHEDAENAHGMEQLAAPARSMRALADWFLRGAFVNLERPLGSLAMVLSEPGRARYKHPVKGVKSGPLPQGTVEDVKNAIVQWSKRADDDVDNLLIFAFCGHGVSAGSSVLLCRDYGRVPENRFDGAINFDTFRATLSSRMPNQQLLFVDACRTPDAVANAMFGMAAPGQSPLTARDLALRGGSPALQSVHFATSPHTQSWGRTKGLSLYTEALLRALGGGGVQPELDMWVGTNGLQSALAAYTGRIAKLEGVEQAPDRTSSPNFKVHLPKEVKLPVYLKCAPNDVWQVPCNFEASDGAKLVASVKHSPKRVANLDPTAIVYEMELPIQTYDFAACFAGRAPYARAELLRKTVFPPLADCAFQVARRDAV